MYDHVRRCLLGDLPVQGTTLLVLVTLADAANPDGASALSVATISAAAGLSDGRGARDHLRALVGHGLVVVRRDDHGHVWVGPHGCMVYVLSLPPAPAAVRGRPPRFTPVSPGGWVFPVAPAGGSPTPGGAPQPGGGGASTPGADTPQGAPTPPAAGGTGTPGGALEPQVPGGSLTPGGAPQPAEADTEIQTAAAAAAAVPMPEGTATDSDDDRAGVLAEVTAQRAFLVDPDTGADLRPNWRAFAAGLTPAQRAAIWREGPALLRHAIKYPSAFLDARGQLAERDDRAARRAAREAAALAPGPSAATQRPAEGAPVLDAPGEAITRALAPHTPLGARWAAMVATLPHDPPATALRATTVWPRALSDAGALVLRVPTALAASAARVHAVALLAADPGITALTVELRGAPLPALVSAAEPQPQDLVTP